MSAPSLRPMRATDMVKQTKYVIPQFFGVVVVLEGRDIGSGSIVWGDDGRAYLCLEITEELRQKPVFMVKVARDLIAAAIKANGELFTIEDKEEPTSERFLAFLGFTPTGESRDGERVLQWLR
jgi:hypothetical protein